MKIFKILINPNAENSYYWRMVSGLANGFKSIGHQAYAIRKPLSSIQLLKKCKEMSPDVVIEINRTRSPEHSLPSGIRHIAWFQDVFPETLKGFEEKFQDSDILYTLGSPEIFGFTNLKLKCQIDCLLTGVDPKIFEYKQDQSKDQIDFSLCGYIPPVPLHRRTCLPVCIEEILRAFYRCFLLRNHVPRHTLMLMMNTVMRLYQPLRGNLNIHELEYAMRHEVAKMSDLLNVDLRQYSNSRVFSEKDKVLIGEKVWKNDFHPYEREINFHVIHFPRLLDRRMLINEILEISKSLELYGNGWDKHPEFRKYHKGVLTSQNELLDVYTRSRINLANNTHGLGLHSRTLECMAVGGFIFTHKSPNDEKPGGMLTSFEPGTHYGSFTPENLKEEALFWLVNDTKRKQAGLKAADVVRKNHCWHHRAQQIIDDLAE